MGECRKLVNSFGVRSLQTSGVGRGGWEGGSRQTARGGPGDILTTTGAIEGIKWRDTMVRSMTLIYRAVGGVMGPDL